MSLHLLNPLGRGRAVFLAAGCVAALALAGCERRERVLEVQTPDGEITVDRVESTTDGNDRVEVEVDD